MIASELEGFFWCAFAPIFDGRFQASLVFPLAMQKVRAQWKVLFPVLWLATMAQSVLQVES
jgi:hypothetical protein